MKIGLYGGTFDPLHFGHLNLAIQIFEYHKLDKILFCPAYISPLKQHQTPSRIEDRLAMVSLAIEKIKSFELLDWEATQSKPSYTIDTLQMLTTKDGGKNQYFLILGDDSLKDFIKWKEPQKILELAPLLVGKRSIVPLEWLNNLPDWLKNAALQGSTPTRTMEISGTEIRQRIKDGLYCGHLLPREVVDYIAHHRLYL